MLIYPNLAHGMLKWTKFNCRNLGIEALYNWNQKFQFDQRFEGYNIVSRKNGKYYSQFICFFLYHPRYRNNGTTYLNKTAKSDTTRNTMAVDQCYTPDCRHFGTTHSRKQKAVPLWILLYSFFFVRTSNFAAEAEPKLNVLIFFHVLSLRCS